MCTNIAVFVGATLGGLGSLAEAIELGGMSKSLASYPPPTRSLGAFWQAPATVTEELKQQIEAEWSKASAYPPPVAKRGSCVFSIGSDHSELFFGRVARRPLPPR